MGLLPLLILLTGQMSKFGTHRMSKVEGVDAGGVVIGAIDDGWTNTQYEHMSYTFSHGLCYGEITCLDRPTLRMAFGKDPGVWS